MEKGRLGHIAILALVATAAQAQPHRFPSKGSAAQRAAYARGQAAQIAFEQQQFVRAGFEPIDAVAAQRRTVKRVLFGDPYMILRVPGVEIERHADGSVTLRVIGRAGATDPATLPASAWTRLNALQGTLFRPRPYVPWDPPKPNEPMPPPPPVCHGWSVRFGTADDTGIRSGSWSGCGGKDRPESAYAVEFARLAVATRPDCTFVEANPFWSFSGCFSPRPQN